MAGRYAFGLRHVGAEPPPDPGERTLLTQSDLTWLGCWRMPDNPVGSGDHDNRAGRGLALRRVGEELRAFSTVYEVNVGFKIYEMVVPQTLGATVGSSPHATVSRVWGYPTNGVAGIYHVYWDAPTERLFYMGGDSYVDNGHFLCFGSATLNEGTGTLDNTAAWRLDGRSSKYCMHGITPVPEWFADAYCPGMRLALGFGGYESLVDAGPASLGPSLTAFDPSGLGATGSALAASDWRALLAYPYNATSYTNPTRAHRSTDYTSLFDDPPHWNPNAGIGYWTWTDYIWGGGCWVDTPTKTGFIVFNVPGVGLCEYVSSDLECENCKHAAQIYDPADLARVAQGLAPEYTPQPVEQWDVQFQSLSYPMPGWRSLPFQLITGVVYDPVTSRLHVSVKEANGASSNPNPNVVHVYQVAA